MCMCIDVWMHLHVQFLFLFLKFKEGRRGIAGDTTEVVDVVRKVQYAYGLAPPRATE